MDRDRKLLILALAVPLLLYGIPYAYATTQSSSYVVSALNSTPPSTDSGEVAASCNGGDYATGGGVRGTFPFAPGNLELRTSAPGSGGLTIFSGQPTQWIGEVINSNTQFSENWQIFVVCQSPIAVAGIGVPEFGSLYAAIALAAVLYFALSALRQKRTPTIPTPK